MPVPDPNIEKRRKRILLSGDVPSPLKPPAGCRFHPRCRYMRDSCRVNDQNLDPAKPEHLAACEVRPFAGKRSDAALVAL